MLNEFFFYVFPKILSWQSLSELQVTTLDYITYHFLWSTHRFLPLSKSRCFKCQL